MTERSENVLEQAASWRAEGRAVALATVVDTWGSSPRPVGSQMAVDDRNNMVGSVSGGCIEGAVVLEAQAVLAGAPPNLHDFGIQNEQSWDDGFAFGGTLPGLDAAVE